MQLLKIILENKSNILMETFCLPLSIRQIVDTENDGSIIVDGNLWENPLILEKERQAETNANWETKLLP